MDYSKVKLGIIGCGNWGLNHVRTAHGLLGSNLLLTADAKPDAIQRVHTVSPKIPFTSDIHSLIAHSNINAVVIATPAETHFDLAKRCIENGKHVLIEKPITLISEHTVELLSLAQKHDVKIMVGHVLLYHPAVLKLKQMMDEGYIGKLQYIYSNRLNLGAIRSEENSLWSFAPHDISIVQYLIGKNPETIEAKGAAFVQKNVEDSTITYLTYPGNIHVHVFVSWLHPFKEQRLVVIGDKGMIVFEDSLKTDKLKFYKKGFQQSNGKIEKFEVDFEVIPFDAAQPLSEEHRHFYDCLLHGKTPRTDGEHALEVLRILEKAQERITQHV